MLCQEVAGSTDQCFTVKTIVEVDAGEMNRA
jgi:hypothetical protein